MDAAPVRRRPWPPWPVFAEDEVSAAASVLRSGNVNYWTGDRCREFEERFAQFCGVPFGIAVANGTVALELCLEALSIGPGDDVIVPARTFAATGACIVRAGARPVFADIDAESGCLDLATLQAAVTPRTKAVIAVHLGGWPAPLDEIAAFCRDANMWLVEDCAQAHGAALGDRRVGSWGDMAAFSFCQDKILTTGGEGGMIVCRERDLWRRAWELKDHGKSWDAVHEPHPRPGFRWLHESIGTNARLTEMQAAIGLLQLQKLPEWIDTRRRHAGRLAEGLASHPALRAPFPDAPVHHVAYRFYAYIRPERLAPGWNRDRIMQAVEAEGIPCRTGSCSEIYLERAFEPFRPSARLSVAQMLAEQSLCFLVHPTLEAEDIEDTLKAVDKVLRQAEL